MNDIKYRKNMKRCFTSWMLSALAPFMLCADEGMWMLPLLKQQRLAQMQSLGLTLEGDRIYHPDSASLKDAVVIFDGGCTGGIISNEGLLLTNHHCAYSRIQQHSTPERDYLSRGYWAAGRREELPCPGLSVSFTERIEEVTEYVIGRLEKDPDPGGMNFLSSAYLNLLAKEKVGEQFLSEHPGVEVEIRAFFGGNQYYMFTKKRYTDVRLVGVPPSSIGRFGADTDQGMWPRHTGDFALFRIYADAGGNPADYAENNVPLRPKYRLRISTRGLEENDFAMMLGYPARTHHDHSSWEVAEQYAIDLAVGVHIRGLRRQLLQEEMLRDSELRIRYADKYAAVANAHKNALGARRAIRRQLPEEAKRVQQEQLLAWAGDNHRGDYPEVLRMMEQIVQDRKSLRFRSRMLNEALVRGIEFTAIPTRIQPVAEALRGKDRAAGEEQLRLLSLARLRFFNASYAPQLDRKIAKVMLREYRRLVPAHQQPAYFAVVDKKFRGDTDRFIDYLFETSIYGNPENFGAFLARPSARALENDPMIRFAQAVEKEQKMLAAALGEFDEALALERREFVKGLLEMRPGEDYPEANATIRLTYGQKKGYAPCDAVYYESQTTLDGVMEKEDPDKEEFTVPQRLKELHRAKDFAPYAMPEGKMPVAFILNTHTPRGNSGSPVLNARGELVGVNFDRNWEGMGGDIQYLADHQRSIVADIRYILFIIDRYAGAGYLLEEIFSGD
jgi:hypothetical protein